MYEMQCCTQCRWSWFSWCRSSTSWGSSRSKARALPFVEVFHYIVQPWLSKCCNWFQVQSNISWISCQSIPNPGWTNGNKFQYLNSMFNRFAYHEHCDQQLNSRTTSHQLHVKKLRLRRLDTSSLQMMRNQTNPKPPSDTLTWRLF